MIDRFNNSIVVGWPAHHVLYLEAAMSLPTVAERTAAYRDIADLIGRSFQSVANKVYRLRVAQEMVSLRARVSALEDGRVLLGPIALAPLEPSSFADIPSAQLMGGRAPRRQGASTTAKLPLRHATGAVTRRGRPTALCEHPTV